ncbi:MAG: NAD(+) diphosphatase [Sphingomonas sp.]
MTATGPVTGIATGFTGSPLDRVDALRNDAAAIARLAADPAARLLRLHGLDPEIDAAGHLRWDALAAAPADAPLALLGLDPGGTPRFVALGGGGPPARRSPALNDMLDALAAPDAAIFAAARCLVDWHARHRFCANCGTATDAIRAGWARACPACRTEHFPRTDPVVIMIAEHDGRALLGRQASWPAGRLSALAGFVEVGESIEEAVRRELLEESGVRTGAVRYVASQPWPFPSQLMIACIAEALDEAITLDTDELEEARWVPRATIRAALAGDPAAGFALPPPYAIAHSLLTAWAAQGDRA